MFFAAGEFFRFKGIVVLRILRQSNFGLITITVFAVLGALWVFQDVLFSDERLAFRDVSHFYRPLYLHVSRLTSWNWFPLWNPLDGFGTSLAGETTSGVFYPLRALFLVCANIDHAIALFVAVHLLIAAGGTYAISRHIGAPAGLAILAAIQFSCSGAVFFLYTNPPFLAGAAWSTWMFYFAGCLIDFDRVDTPSRYGRFYQVLGLAASAGMSLLCSDPHATYNSLILIGLYLCLRNVRNFVGGTHCWHTIGQQCLQLSLALLFAAALAAPQLTASISWSKESWRSATAQRSLVERAVIHLSDWPNNPLRDESNAAQQNNAHSSLGINGPTPHTSQALDFSVAPWHFGQLLTPYISGRTFPQNTRWTNAIVNEPRMWTPTLYCGLLPCIIFFASLPRFRTWSTWYWLAIFAAACSLGPWGIYSWLIEILPGYGQFRYPAKWLPQLTLCLVIGATSQLVTPDPTLLRNIRRCLSGTVVVCCLLMVSSFFPATCARIALRFVELSTILPDRFAGPFQSELAWQQILYSALQTTAVAVALWFLFRKNNLSSALLGGHPPAYPQNIWQMLFSACALAICVSDSCLTARWQLLTVPTAQSAIASHSESSQLIQRYWRLNRPNSWPDYWQKESSPQRWHDVEEVTFAQRFMRLHLLNNEAVVNSPTSIRATLLEWAWHSVTQLRSQLDADSLRAFDRQFMDRFAIDYQVSEATKNDSWPSHSTATLPPINFVNHTTDVNAAFGLPASKSFLSWHSHWQTLDNDDKHRLNRLQYIIASLSTSWPLPPQVTIDSSISPAHQQPTALPEKNVADTREDRTNPSLSDGRIRWLAFEPMRIEFQVQAEEYGLMRIAHFQDGHWRAHLKKAQGIRENRDVYRVDELCQGVFLPPGNHHVVLEYKPKWFSTSLVLASVSWLVLAASCSTKAIQKAFIVRARNGGPR